MSKQKSKPLIDLDRLHADVRQMADGVVHKDDPYMRMVAGIPTEEAVFHDTMCHADHGLAWIDAWRVVMDGKLMDDDLQGAMTVCSFAVERLKAHVETLAKMLFAAMPRIGRTQDADDALPKARKKRADEKTTRYRRFTTAVQRRLAENPLDSLTYARTRVAEKLGVSFDSVRRATTGLKPTKKMKK